MITAADIRRVLPHRYPMLLVDAVTEFEPGVRLTARKAVTVNEPWYAGLPTDPEFRAALRAYMVWAVSDVLSYPERADVPDGAPMPHWSWDGLQRPVEAG